MDNKKRNQDEDFDSKIESWKSFINNKENQSLFEHPKKSKIFDEEDLVGEIKEEEKYTANSDNHEMKLFDTFVMEEVNADVAEVNDASLISLKDTADVNSGENGNTLLSTPKDAVYNEKIVSYENTQLSTQRDAADVNSGENQIAHSPTVNYVGFSDLLNFKASKIKNTSQETKEENKKNCDEFKEMNKNDEAIFSHPKDTENVPIYNLEPRENENKLNNNIHLEDSKSNVKSTFEYTEGMDCANVLASRSQESEGSPIETHRTKPCGDKIKNEENNFSSGKSQDSKYMNGTIPLDVSQEVINHLESKIKIQAIQLDNLREGIKMKDDHIDKLTHEILLLKTKKSVFDIESANNLIDKGNKIIEELMEIEMPKDLSEDLNKEKVENLKLKILIEELVLKVKILESQIKSD